MLHSFIKNVKSNLTNVLVSLNFKKHLKFFKSTTPYLTISIPQRRKKRFEKFLTYQNFNLKVVCDKVLNTRLVIFKNNI